MSTELEPYAPPTPAEWAMYEQQAAALARSSIIPRDYRGQPANVLVAALHGRRFGWDVMASMANASVIEGIYTIKPHAMAGMIRRAGHSITGRTWMQGVDIGAEITGKRGDDGEEMTVAFTIEHAVIAGLVAIVTDKDAGQPRLSARSTQGKKLPWELYPEDMCWARALGRLANRLFSDVIQGAMVEGAVDTEWEQPAGPSAVDQAAADPQPISDQMQAQVRAAFERDGLDADVLAASVAVATEGRTRDLAEVLTSEVGALRAAHQSAKDRMNEVVVDAEVVEETPPPADVAPPAAPVAHEPEHEPSALALEPCSAAERRTVMGAVKRAGVDPEDRATRLRVFESIVAHPVSSTNDLTHMEAAAVIDALNAVIDGRARFQRASDGSAIIGVEWGGS